VPGSCVCGNKPAGSIKDGEFRDLLNDSQIFNNDSAPWSYFIGVISF
jgi:hypothetical protein